MAVIKVKPGRPTTSSLENIKGTERDKDKKDTVTLIVPPGTRVEIEYED